MSQTIKDVSAAKAELAADILRDIKAFEEKFEHELLVHVEYDTETGYRSRTDGHVTIVVVLRNNDQ